VREHVQIRQKTVRSRPIDTRLDALSGILCGAKTIAQNNSTIRTDRAVQRACGRTGCAEQSTMARTLRACTAKNVTQLEQVSWYYLKRYGATPRHRFHDTLLWVDIDLTPMPIGARAEGSERTWMGRHRSKTGRTTLRITASLYREILHETLLRGKETAVPALKSALQEVESRFGWTREWRAAYRRCARGDRTPPRHQGAPHEEEHDTLRLDYRSDTSRPIARSMARSRSCASTGFGKKATTPPPIARRRIWSSS